MTLAKELRKAHAWLVENHVVLPNIITPIQDHLRVLETWQRRVLAGQMDKKEWRHKVRTLLESLYTVGTNDGMEMAGIRVAIVTGDDDGAGSLLEPSAN